MIVLNLTRGNSPLRVPLRLPATPADIGAAYAKLDTISTDDRETHIGSAITGVGALDRWLRDRPMNRPGDYIELGELAERINKLDEQQRKTFDGALTGAAFENVADIQDHHQPGRQDFAVWGERFLLRRGGGTSHRRRAAALGISPAHGGERR